MIEEGTHADFKRSILAELPAIPKVGELWRTHLFEVFYNVRIDRFQYFEHTGWNIVLKLQDMGDHQDRWYRIPVDDFVRRMETGKAVRIK